MRAGRFPERLLAEEGVEVDAAEALLLAVDRRGAAGLVVGDDQLAVVVELEPVDDAPQRELADRGLEPQLQPDGAHRTRVLHREVPIDQHGCVSEEGLLRRLVERRAARTRDRHATRRRRGRGRRPRPLACGRAAPAEQQLQCPVDKGALGGRRVGRLRQLVDGGEPERQGARGERLHPGGRQARGDRIRHGPDATRGVRESWRPWDVGSSSGDSARRSRPRRPRPPPGPPSDRSGRRRQAGEGARAACCRRPGGPTTAGWNGWKLPLSTSTGHRTSPRRSKVSWVWLPS